MGFVKIFPVLFYVVLQIIAIKVLQLGLVLKLFYTENWNCFHTKGLNVRKVQKMGIMG